MCRTCLFLATLLIAFITGTVHAQTLSDAAGDMSLLVGLSGGTTFTTHEEVPVFNFGDAACRVDSDGTYGTGPIVGGGAETRWGSSGFGLSIAWFDRSAEGRGMLPDAQVILPGTTEPVRQSVRFDFATTYHILEAYLYFRQVFLPVGAGGLGLRIGPQIGRVTTATVSYTQHLLEPSNGRFVPQSDYRYSSDGRTIFLAENDPITEARSHRLSLRGGLFWDQAIGPLHIIPEISYDYGITPVRSGSDWHVHSINVTLDVMFALGSL